MRGDELLVAVGAGVALLATAAVANLAVYNKGRSLARPIDEVRPAQAALVLGAYVHPDGTPCPALADRLITAHDLYRAGKVKKILLSGDHSEEYDEVNGMRVFLEARGVPKEDLFLDHAGFDTYDSLKRARDVFGARALVIVTQAFHLPRALYIGQALGLEVEGVAADRRPLREIRYLQFREMGARLKAVAEVVTSRTPKPHGHLVGLEGDATVTHDPE